jgi:hypothetical protein
VRSRNREEEENRAANYSRNVGFFMRKTKGKINRRMYRQKKGKPGIVLRIEFKEKS